MPKTKEKFYDKEKSMTKMLVEYHRKWSGGDSKQRTYYSFLKQDKKSKQKGMSQLRKFAHKNVVQIQYAAIYDNISGEIIENIINNGVLV